MKQITVERLREVLAYDPETGIFTRKVSTNSRVKIGDVATHMGPFGYLYIQVDGGRYFAHRVAWFYQTGSWPAEMIDHINGVKSDNRFANLREATRSQNMQNRRTYKSNACGLKGVGWNIRRNRWQAKISVNGTRMFLGYFDTPEEAHAAYVAAAERHHGEFANVNGSAK